MQNGPLLYETGGVDDILPDLDERYELTYYINDEPVEIIEAPTQEMLEEKMGRIDVARNQYAGELLNAEYEDLT